MRQTVFKKLTASFFVFSLIIIAFMWLITSSVLDREFEDYLLEVNRAEVEETFQEIVQMYQSDFAFSSEEIRDIRRLSNRNGYSIEVLDGKGQSLLSFDSQSSGFRHSRVDAISEEAAEAEFSFEALDGTGRVVIGFREPFSLNAEDIVFKSAIRKSLGFGSAMLLFLSLIISYFLSRRIADPIRKLKLVAEKIKSGEWSHKYISLKSDPKEIYDLSEAIDKMSDTLKFQEDMRKRLVSDMAHELRTPIAVLKTHLEAMIEGVWEPETERLRELYVEADMLNELVDKLKDIHVLENAGQTLNLEKVEIESEVRSVVNPLIPMFAAKNIDLKLKTEANATVKLDKSKFKQIMYNLLLNSYNYSKSGEDVEIIIKEAESGLEVKVIDSGLGISEEDLPYIFERFYRGEKSRNREQGGTGLGLTIVKALVDAHGWEIDAKSELGVGSELVVTIPRKNLENS